MIILMLQDGLRGVNMIKYRKGYDIDYIRLVELLTESGSDTAAYEFNKLVQMVESSAMVLTAWDFDYMVAFARVVFEGDDGYITDLVVDREYRNMDIEKNMISNILASYPDRQIKVKDKTTGS